MRRRWLAPLIFLMLSGIAAAGTINLRRGSVVIADPRLGDGPVHLEGNRHFEADAYAELAFLSIGYCDFGCPPGELASLDFIVNGNDLPARVELDGILYNDVGDLSSRNQLQIIFDGQVKVPRLRRQPRTQRAPVTYEITFWHDMTVETMTGNGVAIITWERYEDFWYADHITYKVRR